MRIPNESLEVYCSIKEPHAGFKSSSSGMRAILVEQSWREKQKGRHNADPPPYQPSSC